MTTDQLKHLEADLARRGYKLYTSKRFYVHKEDRAWFKSFGEHEDPDGEREIDYQIAFRIYEMQRRHPELDMPEQSHIWLTASMLPELNRTRLDCDWQMQVEVPDIDLCERIFKDMFEVIRKYKL